MTAAEFDSISRGARTNKADSVQKAGKADSTQKMKVDSMPKAPARGKPGAPLGAKPGAPPGAGPGAFAGQQPAVKLSRPPLSDRLVVRLGAPVAPGKHYLVATRDVKNVSGILGSPKAGFEVPKRPKPTLADSARLLRTRIDSALAKGDTTFADSLKQLLPPDSLLKPPGAPPKKETAPQQ